MSTRDRWIIFGFHLHLLPILSSFHLQLPAYIQNLQTIKRSACQIKTSLSRPRRIAFAFQPDHDYLQTFQWLNSSARARQ
ncbi:hypothetical protein KC354_g95 [Hortaea werneckii]|nr:hypothetical protein KC354_g95 [Hortaea werneckii]